nr:MAG TPA: SAP30 SAP30 zinc-finger [Caudoviricetes sp.]
MRRYNLHRKCEDITGYMPSMTVICDYHKTRRSRT